jgi:hypothetical protein
MACPRCSADTPSWCKDCERLYDGWSRQHATDILWQTGGGALVAMIVGLGAPLLGLTPILGIVGVLAGATTAALLRRFGNRRRRQQFLTASVPRAYLPGS